MLIASAWLARRETLIATVLLVLAAAAATTWYLRQPLVLTIAVAPRDGTEPELIRAYADALEQGRESVRLKIVSFNDVHESADALQRGSVDLAVVRPDVLLPTNGLTLAVLRDQAMLIVSPSPAGIDAFPKLAGKRLGIGVHRDADFWLLQSVLAYYGLELGYDDHATAGDHVVHLVAVDEGDVAIAFRERRIDAFVSIIAPSAPQAVTLVNAVHLIAADGKVDFIAVADDHAVIDRLPKLQAVSVPGGLFMGNPKLPADDVKTVGASYRLMARSTLSRVAAADVTQQLFEKRPVAARATVAAEYIMAPPYDSTVAATSARIPIHPGAIDYYQREQRSFIERYGNTLYLLGVLAGAIISTLAWIWQHLARLRRERIDEIIERLLEIIDQARLLADPLAIEALNLEVDALAKDVVRYACRRQPDAQTLSAVAIALETARTTISDCRRFASGRSQP